MFYPESRVRRSLLRGTVDEVNDHLGSMLDLAAAPSKAVVDLNNRLQNGWRLLRVMMQIQCGNCPSSRDEKKRAELRGRDLSMISWKDGKVPEVSA